MLGVNFLSLLLIVFSGLTYQSAPAQLNFQLFGERFERIFFADGLNAVYSLGKSFARGQVQAVLILRSDSVLVEEKLLERSAYLLDIQEGKVIFFTRLPELSTIRVVYRYLIFSDESKDRGREALRTLEPRTSDTLISVTKIDKSGAASAGNWIISGNKSLGFSAGNVSGVGIDQATNVVLSGQIEDVSVEAEISDQSSSIPPEGTTRELEELDRIAIALRGTGWQGNFGDVTLGLDGGLFGRLERRAVGAVVHGSKGIFTVSGGYAKPRGEFGSLLFNGIDGVQGPYRLSPDGQAAEIVPGSEKVYLDGKPMVRGWDADYTIDYSTGELFFTNRHLIDGRSRIEVKFQFVTNNYERNIAFAGFSVRPEPVHFELAFFQEGDNLDRSSVLNLSEEEKRLLGALGRDTIRAWLSGGEFVGFGKGDYELEEDHFRYVGPGKGSYQVHFTLKGDSLGSYVYDGMLPGFRFVGKNKGNYIDSVRVVLPKRQDLAYGKLLVNFGKLNGAVEGALGRKRVNLFARDGAQDQASGMNLTLSWQDSIWGVDYRHRVAGSGFNFPGETKEVDFSYRWAGTNEKERKLSDEVMVRIAPRNFLEFTGELGRLERFRSPELVRLGATGRIKFLTLEGIKVADFLRVGATVAPRVFHLIPRSGLLLEERKGERNRGWVLGIDLQPGDKFVGGVGFQWTGFDERDTVLGKWRGSGGSGLLSLNCNWSLVERVKFEGVAGYHMRRYYESPQANWSRIFGSLNTVWTPVSGLRVAIDFHQSSRQVELREEQFRYVGPGQGGYMRDSITGGYVSSPNGDYERLVVYLGRFTTAQEITGHGVIELIRYEPVDFFLTFSHNWMRSDTGLVGKILCADLRTDLLPLSPNFIPTVGFSVDRSLDKTLSVTGRMVARYQIFLEMTSSMLKEVELRGRLERDELTRHKISEFEYLERGWRFSFSPIIGERLRLELNLAYEPKEISEPLAYPELGWFRVDAFEGWVAKSTAFASKMRFRIRVGGIYRSSSVKVLPWDVELSQPLGLVPEVSAELEQLISEIFSATGRYTFSTRSGHPTEHQVSFELRAFF